MTRQFRYGGAGTCERCSGQLFRERNPKGGVDYYNCLQCGNDYPVNRDARRPTWEELGE